MMLQCLHSSGGCVQALCCCLRQLRTLQPVPPCVMARAPRHINVVGLLFHKTNLGQIPVAYLPPNPTPLLQLHLPVHILHELCALESCEYVSQLRPDGSERRPHQVSCFGAFNFLRLIDFTPLPLQYADIIVTGPKASLRSTSERQRASKRPRRNASMCEAVLSTHGITSHLRPSGLA
jgi:hypothetical protein